MKNMYSKTTYGLEIGGSRMKFFNDMKETLVSGTQNSFQLRNDSSLNCLMYPGDIFISAEGLQSLIDKLEVCW